MLRSLLLNFKILSEYISLLVLNAALKWGVSQLVVVVLLPVSQGWVQCCLKWILDDNLYIPMSVYHSLKAIFKSGR